MSYDDFFIYAAATFSGPFENRKIVINKTTTSNSYRTTGNLLESYLVNLNTLINLQNYLRIGFTFS